VFFSLFLGYDLIVLDVMALVGDELVFYEAVVVLELLFEEFRVWRYKKRYFRA
jgi:hypothetical protein